MKMRCLWLTQDAQHAESDPPRRRFKPRKFVTPTARTHISRLAVLNSRLTRVSPPMKVQQIPNVDGLRRLVRPPAYIIGWIFINGGNDQGYATHQKSRCQIKLAFSFFNYYYLFIYK